MADSIDTPLTNDVPKPNDDSKANGPNLDQPKPENPSTPDETKRAEDDQAHDNDIRATRDVINNNIFLLMNNNISGSAFGSDAQVIFEKIDNARKTSDKRKKASKDATDSKLNWDTWFREKKIREQAFIISLLFFPGNSPSFIVSMANELVRLFGVRIEPVDATASIFGNETSISGFLRDGFVKINRESINTEAGKLDFDSISIENNEALSIIKQIVLKDYDLVSLRSIIRQWLVTLIKSDNNKIQKLGSITPDLPRVQAGFGIGLLARTELDALSLVIRPWASSENPNDRLMVGWIFLGYFEENSQSAYWTTVSSLLKHWASLNNYYLRWTAIASTTRLGLIVSPEDDSSLVLSMSIFKEICKSGQVNLFRGTFRGVLLKSLRFLFGLSSYHSRIISIELALWLKDDTNLMIQDIAAELFIEIIGVSISIDNGNSDIRNISIWELCESESYILSDAVYNLIHRALVHQKGSFVDYTVKQISQSVQKVLEKEIIHQKVMKNIFTQLREDKLTARYVPLILGNYQNKI